MMCASVTLSGSQGMSRLHVCVEKIVALSGSVTASGVVAIVLLMACADAVRKCPEAPESLSA